MVQRPGEKPLVALVFRGRKGVGKNILINAVGRMIRGHFLTTSNRRFLLGSFNSHLENLLMFVLDEAFWSGDKQADGILKDLITGERHFIERKGLEPYTVKNCTRVVIIGNEDWVVPVSEDERRFAVYNVGEGKMQDLEFFTELQQGMLAGGDRLFLEYLQKVDLSKININRAPRTEELLEQKLQSLHPVYQCIFDALADGTCPGQEDQAWPTDKPYVVQKDMLTAHLQQYFKSHQIGGRIVSAHMLTKLLTRAFSGILGFKSFRATKADESGRKPYFCSFPALPKAREQWEKFLGQKINWEAPNEDSK